MTAYIRVAAAALAAATGALFGMHAKPQPRTVQFTAPKAQSVFYAPQVACTFTWVGHDVTLFTNAACQPTGAFLATDGYAPTTGNPEFGVVCALRRGDTFEIIANVGGNPNAGDLCTALLGKGWTEDPQLGADFNDTLEETSNAVRA